MSQLVDILYADHRRIEAKLDEVDRVTSGPWSPFPAAFFEEMVTFVSEFADGEHHQREETMLFPALVQAGVPVEHGPIAVMLHEHDLGRDCMRRIRENLEAARGGNESAAAAVFTAATDYSELLRAHIWKEDNVLFPLANRLVPDAMAA